LLKNLESFGLSETTEGVIFSTPTPLLCLKLTPDPVMATDYQSWAESLISDWLYSYSYSYSYS